MQPFAERHGLRGAMVAPTKIIAGLGLSLGLELLPCPGATGDYRSDFGAKVQRLNIPDVLISAEILAGLSLGLDSSPRRLRRLPLRRRRQGDGNTSEHPVSGLANLGVCCWDWSCCPARRHRRLPLRLLAPGSAANSHVTHVERADSVLHHLQNAGVPNHAMPSNPVHCSLPN